MWGDGTGLRIYPGSWKLLWEVEVGNEFHSIPGTWPLPTMSLPAETHCVLAARKAARCEPQTVESSVSPQVLPLEGQALAAMQQLDWEEAVGTVPVGWGFIQ